MGFFMPLQCIDSVMKKEKGDSRCQEHRLSEVSSYEERQHL